MNTTTREVRRFSDLPLEARQVLAELELLLDDDGLGHGTSDEPEFLRYRQRLLTCREDQIPGAIVQARGELRACSRRTAPAVDRYDVRQVVLRECSGWSPTDVERSSHKASARTVRKWRSDDGRDPETGRPMPGRPGSAEEKVERLALEGKSVRVIALSVGLAKSTVSDMLLRLTRQSA